MLSAQSYVQAPVIGQAVGFTGDFADAERRGKWTRPFRCPGVPACRPARARLP